MTISLNKKSPDNWSVFDHKMMSLALELAAKGQYSARPNPMVGCVLTKENEIVAQGWHQKSGLPHAEVNALEIAGNKSKNTTCYVTLEPCAHIGKTGPCAKALIKSGVRRVVAAMLDPNPEVSGKGFQMLLDAGIQVEYGLLEDQARRLNRGFISRFTRKRPWVTCKLAMSLDGRTALANGESQWITGAAARADVQKLRARHDAIMTGVGTLLADDPSLNVRAEGQAWFTAAKAKGFAQPARILFDRKAQAKSTAKFYNDDAKVYWLTENMLKIGSENEFSNTNITHLSGKKTIDEYLSYFAGEGMNNLLLESGHRLAGEFLNRDLIDELVIYMAPKLMGNRAMGLFEMNIDKMLNTPRLKLQQIRQLDEDIRLTYQIQKMSTE